MTNTPTDTPEAPSAEVEASAADTTPAAPVEPPEPVPFWQRPLVERYVVPLLLPVFVVAGLVAYVLNISRIFLAGHGHIPVIVGSVITALILIGAALLSAGSERLRQPAVVLVGAGFIVSIMGAGWLVLGSAQPKETGPTTLPETVKASQTLEVTAAPGGALSYAPNHLDAKTGLAKIDVTVAAPGHTFNMRDATTLFENLSLDQAGTKKAAVAFFAKPDSYYFFCAIPGHEAAGMHGTITVTGPTMTLDQALKAAGNAPGAAG
jgi:uncharacterized cupredoxin-like copper-binding protein